MPAETLLALFYYWVFRAQSLDWLYLQLYALHSSLLSESPFKSCLCYWFPSLYFFLFLFVLFTFFHFHILCLFPSVLSVLISSGGSVKLRVVFWLECGGGLEFRWRAAGHHEGVWSDVSSGVSPAPLDPQANLNSSKTCSLKITMPLSLAAFDSSDDSD